jgi:molecular chaperone DnaK (HSP70)
VTGPVGQQARYTIGIDLGTTNTAVAYVDTRSTVLRVRTFEVPQLVAPGAVDRRPQLPSFVYLAGEHDLAPAETALPWDEAITPARAVVGELARHQGVLQPSRMVASAKSWLCHGGVDRHAAILPWGVQDGPRLSPVEASARVLAHVRAAWDHQHGDDAEARFADQDVIVTVPASFDEAARELTLLAAARAGYGKVALLEEPQAAFYAWIHRQHTRRRLRPGERVLVFDVGGGTTDFTVIDVSADGRSFERTAVGDHLLLGGDNIDLTLAKMLEAQLTAGGESRRLDPLQWHGLVHACRLAKETLLANPDVAALPVTVSGRSSKLIGSTLRAELTRTELQRVLHDGFFPETQRQDLPRRSRGGLQEFGLPYAADPAITRHLAAFLRRHGVGRVDVVLFNGGAMAPAELRRRVIDQIGRWQPEVGPPRELTGRAPELAVAEGAARYGLVRRGLAERIGGGTPRTFYVGVGRTEGRERAVCLAPRGLEDGTAVQLARDFRLLTNRPVSFKLYASTTRADQPGAVVTLVTLSPAGEGAEGDRAGDVVTVAAGAGTADDAADLVELPPIVTALRAPGRGEVVVHLEVRVTDLGSLEIWCREPGEPGADGWRLSFDTRAGGARVQAEDEGEAASAAARSGPVAARGPHAGPPAGGGSGAGDEAAGSDAAENASLAGGGEGAASRGPGAALDTRVGPAQALIRALFAGPPEGLARIVRQLEEQLGAPRDQWPTPTARALFDTTFEVEEQRKRSPHHESRWLNLTGFCLRPGSGAPLDDWRARQMWRIFNEELIHPRAEQCRLAWWIAWRRIAGGLNKGQQHQIYLRLAQLFLPGAKGRKKWDEVKPTAEEAAEMLRCLANMERLSPDAKIPLGDELIRRLESRKAREEGIELWALGRLGARIPLYGPLNCVVASSKAASWLEAALAWSWPQPQRIALSIAQLARRTGDRSRDLPDEARTRAASWLRSSGAERAATLVDQVVALEAREEHIALGDTLPPGLRLVTDTAEA